MYEEYDFIIVGAGIVGPALAKGLALHGRTVLLLERDLSEPDRIVGELLQPAGIEALKKLGMQKAIEGIDAVRIHGYEVIYKGDRVNIPYPPYAEGMSLHAETRQGDAASGRGFHHGRFVMGLRREASQQPGVTLTEATVTDLVRNDTTGRVLGVVARTKASGDVKLPFFAKVTIVCDGTSSKFRKEISSSKPVVHSYFVGTMLQNPQLPEPGFGHVIIGPRHKPILIYQTSSSDARILCDVPAPLPSVSSGALKKYLELNCLPYLPKETQPAFRKALDTSRLRSMPNQYLPAAKHTYDGLILLGDALNMRHPLTGGGMTVGLSDAVLLSSLLGPKSVNITDDQEVKHLLNVFYRERKGTSSVINVLSVALYSLFAAASSSLEILQKGCFRYFQFGGACVRDPAALLSGLLPKPLLLFYHFFAVVFWAIVNNFQEKGVTGVPLAVYQAFATLWTAIVVFVPFLIKEML